MFSLNKDTDHMESSLPFIRSPRRDFPEVQLGLHAYTAGGRLDPCSGTKILRTMQPKEVQGGFVWLGEGGLHV